MENNTCKTAETSFYENFSNRTSVIYQKSYALGFQWFRNHLLYDEYNRRIAHAQVICE